VDFIFLALIATSRQQLFLSRNERLQKNPLAEMPGDKSAKS
jgi:hypothetical protein